MQIPPVMTLEIAMGMMKTRTPEVLMQELHEFNELGSGRWNQILSMLPQGTASSGPSDQYTLSVDAMAGYLLGLETARAILATNIQAVQVGIQDLI